jgi:hypothetical protein
MPSQENQLDGPRRGALEGDVGEAFKILSLRMPRSPSVRGIAPPSLLQSRGAAGVPGGANPQAAIFEALIRAMLGQGAAPGGPMGGPSAFAPPPAPRVIPGGDDPLPGGNQFDRTNPGMGNRNGSAPSAFGPPRDPRLRRSFTPEY